MSAHPNPPPHKLARWLGAGSPGPSPQHRSRFAVRRILAAPPKKKSPGFFNYAALPKTHSVVSGREGQDSRSRGTGSRLLDGRCGLGGEPVADRLGQSWPIHLPFYARDNLSIFLDPAFHSHESTLPCTMSKSVSYRIEFGADLPAKIPQIGSACTCAYLSGGCASCATANIPSPRLRAKIVLLEQSRWFPCCNLTRKMKQTRPCNDCPTSSLQMILRVAQTVVCSHWTTRAEPSSG
jgi:hypothetical protein